MLLQKEGLKSAQRRLYSDLPALRSGGTAVADSTTVGPGLAVDCCEPLVVTIVQCDGSLSLELMLL